MGAVEKAICDFLSANSKNTLKFASDVWTLDLGKGTSVSSVCSIAKHLQRAATDYNGKGNYVYEILATFNDLLIKQRSVIEFLAAEGCSAANIHERMKTVYCEMCISLSDCTVRKWVRICKGEDPRETILRDRKRSDTAHREKVDCMIRSNRRVKQKEIADEVSLSKERVHHIIITTVLGYRKVSARWVPRQLTVEMKAQRKDMCTQLLESYNAEGEAFLQSILTGDESWVYHYDPECRAQSMECSHKTSPNPRKFKVVASARKVLFTVFWDMEGVFHMEFLEKGQTVNS
ncbi:transposase [Plakobranchus ocellatus]|uniref:Transposase n=1 Tax=Plakobranchus ocellatus TaxID=259542 RepID=A0AAV3YYW2_9GAST|nr:transposase [Plakobranchus ocellatus]